MDNIQIFVSTRIKDNEVPDVLAELGTEVKYINLRHGHFLLSGKYGILYMTHEQFSEAIKSRTLYRTVLDLRHEYEDPLIIVEGDKNKVGPVVGLPSLQGAVLFASVLNRIPILCTKNSMETAQMIFMLAAQTANGTDWPEAVAAKMAEIENHNNNGDDPRLSIIRQLPEVSDKMAASLLTHFGSLSRLFAASANDLKKVSGIGPKRAQKIVEFLSGKAA